ncbi:MAG: hypothetical protein L3K16_08730 [Thermoplasmata archaeon]|nr:hypothetical protein [Thermoplasmata archaeon]
MSAGAGPTEVVDGPAARPRSRRWLVVPLALLAVSAGIVGTFAFRTAPACSPCGGCADGGAPLGTPLALSTPVATGGATNHSYQMSIPPEPGIPWNDPHFQVQNWTGSAVAPGPDWNVTVLDTPPGNESTLAR